ncbi:MAG: zf-HC2 domain-containing protein [Pyrinomonadaceae bacterium]
MKCSDLQTNLSLYADGNLTESEATSVKAHLEVCPLCRVKNAEYRDIRSDLARIRRPEISAALKANLQMAVRSELNNSRRSAPAFSSEIGEWLQMRVMPFGVGVFASLLIGMTFLTMMFSGMLQPKPVLIGRGENESSILLASNSVPFNEDAASFISPVDFAHSRMGFASESPSINPQGGLVALTKSLIRGGMKDEEVVVVADVFGNGLARISEVVESPRDTRSLGDLERALESNPGLTPFVPAVMENRPENIRIVLKFQSVDVSTGSKPSRRRS